MKRPREQRFRANSLARLLIGTGVQQVVRDVTRGSYVEIPGYQIRVTGRAWHGQATIGTVLHQMYAEDPRRAPVGVQLINPEVERGVVQMWVEDWAKLVVRAQ